MVDKKLTKEARRKDLLNIINTIGLRNVNKCELAKKYGISHAQLYDDIAEIIKTIPREQLEVTSFKIIESYEKALSVVQDIVLNPSSHDASTDTRIRAAKALADINEKYTDALERFGYKEKVADKVQVEGSVWDFAAEVNKKRKEGKQ